MKKLFFLIVSLSIIIPCQAVMIYVDDATDPLENGSSEHPFDAIQEAIDAASNGDTVIVNEGTYYENLVIDSLDITLTSIDPNDPNLVAATIINGSSLGSVITIADANDVIDGFTITNGLADNGGGIYCLSSNINISNSVITSNETHNAEDINIGETIDGGDGGGIYIKGSEVHLSSCGILNNQTGNGGYNDLQVCGTGGNGAGLYCLNSTLDCTNTEISGNVTGTGNGGSGGGLYGNNCTVGLEDCRIENNSAGNGRREYSIWSGDPYNIVAGNGGSGGGLYLTNGTEVNVISCQFIQNLAGDGGYACDVGDAGRGGEGGSFWLGDNVIFNISSSDLFNNHAGAGGWALDAGGFSGGNGGHGGCIYSNADLLFVQNCTFTDNSAGRGSEGDGSFSYSTGGSGGAIYDTSSNLIIKGCLFSNNQAGNGSWGGVMSYAGPGGNGGAICSPELSLIDSIFTNNYAGDGGGVYLSRTATEKRAGTGGNGGALFAQTGILSNCLFDLNAAGDGGDGSGHSLPYNSYAHGGHGGNGGGVYGLNIQMDKCTVHSNRPGTGGTGFGDGPWLEDGSDGVGAGIFIDSGTVITNTIVWNNLPDQLFGHDCANVTYCDIGDGICNGMNGNISTEPLFADPNNGDYHLKSKFGRWSPSLQSWVYDVNTSPCIDGGDPNSDWTEELWSHGKRINMGAYGGTPEASMSSSTVGNVADFNNDGTVNLYDFAALAGKWPVSQILLAEDMDRNNMIDIADLAILCQNWLWLDEGDPIIGWWKFNETSGDQASDSSTHENDGTLINGPAWTENGELSFDGIDDYVEVLDSASLVLENQITISTWVQLTEDNDRFMKIITKPSSAVSADPWENYCIDLRRKNPRFIISSGTAGTWSGAYDTTYSSALDVGAWYHIAGTYNGSTMILYVNGQPTQTTAVSIPIGNNALPICIGGVLGADGFGGLIDDVKIYRRALSGIEINNLYQNGLLIQVVSQSRSVSASNDKGSSESFTANTFNTFNNSAHVVWGDYSATGQQNSSISRTGITASGYASESSPFYHYDSYTPSSGSHFQVKVIISGFQEVTLSGNTSAYGDYEGLCYGHYNSHVGLTKEDGTNIFAVNRDAWYHYRDPPLAINETFFLEGGSYILSASSTAIGDYGGNSTDPGFGGGGSADYDISFQIIESGVE